MKRIIEKQIKRLLDISKFMEMGKSMFTTCFAFDCFAQAVEHELIYARSEFMELINEPLFQESEAMLYYIDYGENWHEWKEKFERYARYSDENGFWKKGKWSLWTDELLHPDKKLQKERDENDYLKYKITDYRDKYELRRKLEALAFYMEQMHELTNKLNPQVAQNFFDFKYDEYAIFNRKIIDQELDVKFSCIPTRHIKEDAAAIIHKEGARVANSCFEQYLQEGYDTDRYFYPDGVLNKESAGMYLALHTRELSSEQKDAFLRYVYIREKVEEFVREKEVELDGYKNQKLPNTETSNTELCNSKNESYQEPTNATPNYEITAERWVELYAKRIGHKFNNETALINHIKKLRNLCEEELQKVSNNEKKNWRTPFLRTYVCGQKVNWIKDRQGISLEMIKDLFGESVFNKDQLSDAKKK